MTNEVTRLIDEVDPHGDDHDLDRLSGLVENGAHEDLHQVRITDRHREGRVLGEVEILAGQRRNDHAHRLRDHHEPQGLAGRQAEGRGRFRLPLRDREDARPHHFGDEGCRVGDEPEQEGDEFREDRHAAAQVEGALHRKVERDGIGSDQGEQDPGEDRQAEDQADADPVDRIDPPRRGLLLPAPSGETPASPRCRSREPSR